MRGWLPIYKRELKAYLQSPSTYVVVALYFLIASLIFQGIMIRFAKLTLEAAQQNNVTDLPNITLEGMRDLFNLIGALFLFTVPLLSMRLVAEEKSQGTFEILATCPCSDWGVLIGKFLSLVSVGVCMTVMSAVYPLIVVWTGASVEWPVIATAWLGLILIFATYSAFGIMASALADNQISAAVMTLIGLLVWYLMSEVPLPGFPLLRALLGQASVLTHIENFISGVIDGRDMLFFALSTFLFLFVAAQTLNARRWRM